MKTQLSLRQNKIIQILRNNKDYITSDEISKLLNVSSKTIRTDISGINDSLASDGIRIDSVKGKGFVLCAEDPGLLRKLSKDNRVFLGQNDRIYYLAVRLCTSDEPVNLFDLEEEMAVSSSTLQGDISGFRNRFVTDVPYIELNTSRNELFLEKDERKRRFILVKLLSDNWDYNSTGNVYYESDYIESEAFTIINSHTARILYEHGIFMDDYSLVSLNLYLSVMYHRLKDGQGLNVPPQDTPLAPGIFVACSDMFSVLENELGHHFPDNEILETAYIIAETRLYSRDDFSSHVFPEEYRRMAFEYLDRINEVYGFDLSGDNEFADRLTSFVAHLFRPNKDLTVRDTPDHIKHHLFVEYDVAALFYDLAKGKCRVTENDLLYLAWAVSGAFFNYFARNPEVRFETVVLTHMSVHSMWSLKNALSNQFGGYLVIKDVIPVNQKDFYDFSDAKLILSTVDKKIPGAPCEILTISPYLSKEDSHAIVNRIRNLKIERLYLENYTPIGRLLDEAFVHEKLEFSSRFDLIEYMCRDFIEQGIFTQEHVDSIIRRESISAFAVDPAVVLLYSQVPASQTRLSVLTLDHRIIWNRHKIRIAFMVSLTKEDANELFYLQNTVFHRKFEPEILKTFKTISEIKDHFSRIGS